MNKMIDYYYSKTCNIAMTEIERIATNALLNPDNDLYQYWQAMGIWGFETTEGENVDPKDYYKYPEIQKIEEIMDEWDDYLKLTGQPLHLYWLNSEILKETDW